MKRYKHNLSNTHLLTFDMGELIPVGLHEALPGDTFQLSTSAMIRVSPLAAPVMHPVNVRIHHFFVPHRLVFPEWEDFITGGPDGMDSTALPTEPIPQDIHDTLWDYLGIPPNAKGCHVVNLALQGINKIWNEYYRDEDLQAERLPTDYGLPNISWGKDYFTTARPWTQKGPEVTLPLGTKAPIVGLGISSAWQWGASSGPLNTPGGKVATFAQASSVYSTSPAQGVLVEDDPAHPGFPAIYADLSAAGAVNVNDFRRAFALQRYQEARARYGSRYTEYLRYLGVTPSDARLQRPEYLGGGTARFNFSEVLQTAQAQRGGTPEDSFGVGDLYGHGVAGVRSGRVRRFIEEHGYIHSFVSVRPKGIYMNGINRTFLRATKEDYWQKELEQIGQQPVYLNEISAAVAHPAGAVFGYQDRYSEYKSQPSLVSGEYRDILDYWHLARSLPETTALNDEFVKCVPTKRVFNVQTNDCLWARIENRCVARRMVRKGGGSIIL